MFYSIIIPIYNEENKITTLLNELEPFYSAGHEIIIINDGSTDNSYKKLRNFNFINLINLKKNFGKGIAVRIGISLSKNKKTIIFDGDLELNTLDIAKLMQLDKKKNILSVLGYRFINSSPLLSSSSTIDWGNFIFTVFFNLLHFSNHKDVLSCAKSFYKDDFIIKDLKSKTFDIDIELTSLITKKHNYKLKQIYLSYNRRTINQGKKLRTNDGWLILKRLIMSL